MCYIYQFLNWCSLDSDSSFLRFSMDDIYWNNREKKSFIIRVIKGQIFFI